MSDNSDIRAWARDNGYDVADRGQLPKDVKEAYAAEHGTTTDTSEAPFTIGTPDEVVPKTTSETPPKTGRVKRAVRRKARVSVERVASGVWGFLSNFAGGTNAPLGRALHMQAPIAGLVIEDAVKGTVVDKALQPLARAGERGEAVAALIGVPVVVAAMQTQPQLQAALYPVLRTLVESWLLIAADKAPALKARQEKLAKALGEDIDIDAMIMLWFAPPVGVPADAGVAA